MQKSARQFSDVSTLGIRMILGPGKTLYPKFVPVLFYFNEPAKENIDCSSSAQFHQIGDFFLNTKIPKFMKILDSHSALEVTLFEAAFSDPFMKVRNSMFESQLHPSFFETPPAFLSQSRQKNWTC